MVLRAPSFPNTHPLSPQRCQGVAPGLHRVSLVISFAHREPSVRVQEQMLPTPNDPGPPGLA